MGGTRHSTDHLTQTGLAPRHHDAHHAGPPTAT